MPSVRSSLAICFRVAVALCTQSFFQPDEYFQSLEPAHHLVFGYGQLTWEWTNPKPLRSILYPMVNVPWFWFLKTLGWDARFPWLLVIGPKIIHGILAAFTDIWVCALSRKILNDAFTSTTYFLSLTSFFHALSLSRSLSNSLETSLTTIALSCFPWDYIASSQPVNFRRIDVRYCMVFGALAFILRPTNAIIWMYMFGALFWQLRNNRHATFILFLECAVIGSVALLLAFVLDSTYYGTPTLTILNFLHFNASSVSLFYGSSPWHYYLSQALPILCTTSLPFVLHGTWIAMTKAEPKPRMLLGCIVWTIAVYSVAGHKEWRFLHPLLPMLHILASRSLVELYHRSGNKEAKNKHQRKSCTNLFHSRLPIKPGHLYFLLLTMPASVYIVFSHCTGQIKVMRYLQNQPPDDMVSVGFLMPCHSTPWQAYLHNPKLAQPGRMWALGCEPPLGVRNRLHYKDQTDIFFESPVSYMKTHFPRTVNPTYPPSPSATSIPDAAFIQKLHEVEKTSQSWDLGWAHEWPSHLVLFGSLLNESGMPELLKGKGYAEVWQGGWEWEGDNKRKGGVRVWRHKPLVSS
ncbi:glycosyltransferase family 22 protein [Hygrophoropsis aurantiaca]|uniref:Glycosyltransferase family 22 protein n=1 Tax=Hygrophoropsis aurantiaca TaxID=72124 RepID=A0ACB8A4Z9_9AGAM|nr:glycosyltransferase family 22 protein [Hygrophoropsis aurantiaca]